MDECKPLPSSRNQSTPLSSVSAVRQGLTLVHFSAQRERFLWDRGCAQGLFGGCLGGVWGYYGVSTVYFVSETAQVELKSGRV